MVGDSTPCFRASSIFQQPFPSSTLAIEGKGGGGKVATRASLLLLAGFSVVFSFAGKLDYYELAELVPQRRIFARTAYFLAHPLFGKSFTLRFASALTSSPSSPSPSVSHVTLSRLKVLRTVVKTTNSDEKSLVTGCLPFCRGGSFHNSDGRHYGPVKEVAVRS